MFNKVFNFKLLKDDSDSTTDVADEGTTPAKDPSSLFPPSNIRTSPGLQHSFQNAARFINNSGIANGNRNWNANFQSPSTNRAPSDVLN
jgi:hypothetical protein